MAALREAGKPKKTPLELIRELQRKRKAEATVEALRLGPVEEPTRDEKPKKTGALRKPDYHQKTEQSPEDIMSLGFFMKPPTQKLERLTSKERIKEERERALALARKKAKQMGKKGGKLGPSAEQAVAEAAAKISGPSAAFQRDEYVLQRQARGGDAKRELRVSLKRTLSAKKRRLQRHLAAAEYRVERFTDEDGKMREVHARIRKRKPEGKLDAVDPFSEQLNLGSTEEFFVVTTVDAKGRKIETKVSVNRDLDKQATGAVEEEVEEWERVEEGIDRRRFIDRSGEAKFRTVKIMRERRRRPSTPVDVESEAEADLDVVLQKVIDANGGERVRKIEVTKRVRTPRTDRASQLREDAKSAPTSSSDEFTEEEVVDTKGVKTLHRVSEKTPIQKVRARQARLRAQGKEDAPEKLVVVEQFRDHLGRKLERRINLYKNSELTGEMLSEEQRRVKSICEYELRPYKRHGVIRERRHLLRVIVPRKTQDEEAEEEFVQLAGDEEMKIELTASERAGLEGRESVGRRLSELMKETRAGLADRGPMRSFSAEEMAAIVPELLLIRSTELLVSPKAARKRTPEAERRASVAVERAAGRAHAKAAKLRRGSAKPEEREKLERAMPKDLFATYDWRTRNSFAGRRLSTSPHLRRQSRRESVMPGMQELAEELDRGPVDKKQTPLLSSIAARYDALQERIRGLDSETRLRTEEALRHRADHMTVEDIIQGVFAEDRYLQERDNRMADMRFRRFERQAGAMTAERLADEMMMARQKKRQAPGLDFMDLKVEESTRPTPSPRLDRLPDLDQESLTSEQMQDLRKLRHMTHKALVKDALAVC